MEQKDTPQELFDTSLGGVSVQSEHHDFELDGWGYEQPQPFQSFRCFIGESDIPVSYESLALLQEHPFACAEYRISYTTRRLLTLVLIEKVPSTAGSTLAIHGSDTTAVLDDTWQILRRTQRILNDYSRLAQAKSENDAAATASNGVRFLHLDGPTLTYQSSLETAESKLEDDVQIIADSHCMNAMQLMHQHGVVETFSRSSNGKTWTASRLGLPRNRSKGKKHERQGEEKSGKEERANQTFVVLAGKKISIVDCDREVRRLANAYPSFGI